MSAEDALFRVIRAVAERIDDSRRAASAPLDADTVAQQALDQLAGAIDLRAHSVALHARLVRALLERVPGDGTEAIELRATDSPAQTAAVKDDGNIPHSR